MTDDVKNPVLNISDAVLSTIGEGTKFGAQACRMGPVIGAEQLGAMLTVVEPGMRAFPFHVHHRNEEMFFILEGTGEYRYGDKIYPVKSGDLIAAPAGGTDKAHQLINTGDQDLKYLSFSTMHEPEVAEYPDSGKFIVYSRTQDGTSTSADIRYLGRKENTLDYYDGELDRPEHTEPKNA